MDWNSIAEAKAAGCYIIDIRRPEECAARPLPEADEEVEMTVLSASPADFLPEKQKVLLVCAAGMRAQKTAEALQAQGFHQVMAYPRAW